MDHEPFVSHDQPVGAPGLPATAHGAISDPIEQWSVREVLEGITDGFFAVDFDRRILHFNRRAEEYFGLDGEEVVGRPIDEVLAKSAGSSFAVNIIGAIDDRTARSFEAPSVMRPGRWVEVRVYPAERAVWIFFADITERKQVEDRLRRSEETLRVAVESAELGPWEFNVRTGEVYWSPNLERIHGLEPGSFGGTFEDYKRDMHPEDFEKVVASIQRALEHGNDHLVEYRIVPPDGRMRWVLGRGKVQRDVDGTPLRMTGVCMDVTARKEEEQRREQLLEAERVARLELERLNRLKDEFLSTLSHELRTPLNAIVGWSELLRSGELSDEEVATGIDVIHRNARVQTEIIEDLLDMGRIISGKMRLDVRHVDLGVIVADALETVRPAAEARGVSLERPVDCDAATILGDAARLQQIVWNLLSNAVKFTPRGGRVTVRLERAASRVRLVVSDTGEGMPPEFLEQVFERFRQADASTTRRHGGLGLGLAICRSLVELHGGTIGAASDGPGTGATFTVELPIAALAPTELTEARSDADEPASVSSPTLEAVDLGGLDIVVVDDDVDGRKMIARLLTEFGAVVREASSTLEALELVAATTPALIVSDIGMPDIDGYELIARLRALPASCGGATPAIALTAFARGEDRERALEAGFQAHLTKPAEPAELLALVARLLEPSR